MPALPGHRGGAWSIIVAIAVLAGALRLLFFTGFFGSDDVNAARSALDVARGHWPVTDYVVSQRYGIFLPTALVIRLFGFTEFSVTLWAWLCSVGEVVVACAFACRAWGPTAGLTTGILLATLPLHVHTGGQPTGDAPLAFFITLSLVLFYVAETRGGRGWYFAAGLAAGATFWIKEVATIWVGVFVLHAAVVGRWNRRWLLVAAGFAVMVLASMLLFLVIAGDPLHYFKVVMKRRQDGRMLWLYPYYLFLDLRHTWILGYLALAGAIAWWRARAAEARTDVVTRYVVVWLAGIVLVLTFFVVKLRPLTFVAQQVNYMTMFLAPMALLAGLALARARPGWRLAALSLWLPGAIALAGLEQQAVRAFTANSRAAWEFAQAHRDAALYGTVHAAQMASVLPVPGDARTRPRILPLTRVASEPVGGRPVYVVLDAETMGWGDELSITPADVPACWEPVTRLEPQGYGLGQRIATGLRTIVGYLPDAVGRRLQARLDRIIAPRPAVVYRVPPQCEREVRAGTTGRTRARPPSDEAPRSRS
ncbi:MAG TPA: glycosyltransferase family 39 protein [Candidatus Tectomicrobia bacterium]|nr:glycosyltransferase family 39 protein [Candidatus Tectomicrobia bacterium]